MARRSRRPAKGGHANAGERPGPQETRVAAPGAAAADNPPPAGPAPGHAHPTRGPLASGPSSDRLRTFVDAYIANSGNAAEAARAAGRKGKPASLWSAGSRMLAQARAAGLLDERLAQVRKAIGADEVLQDLNELRLALRGGIEHFMTFPTAKEVADVVKLIKETTPDQDFALKRAAYLVNVLEGRGFVLDVEKGVRAGYGGLIQSIETTHDSAGMPRVKVKLHSRLQAILGLGKLLGLGDQPPGDDSRAQVIRERTLILLRDPGTARQLDAIAAQAFAGKRLVRGQVVDVEGTVRA